MFILFVLFIHFLSFYLFFFGSSSCFFFHFFPPSILFFCCCIYQLCQRDVSFILSFLWCSLKKERYQEPTWLDHNRVSKLLVKRIALITGESCHHRCDCWRCTRVNGTHRIITMAFLKANIIHTSTSNAIVVRTIN